MSYIVTYEDDGTKPYLRASADDGIHGKHNVLFPKNGQMAGIPSRYDKNNVGVQIEVKDLAWKQTGKNGYYGVAPGDIIGVVNPKAKTPQQQQPTPQPIQQSKEIKSEATLLNAKDLQVGQVIKLTEATSVSEYGVVCINPNNVQLFIIDQNKKTYMPMGLEQVAGTVIHDTCYVKVDAFQYTPPQTVYDEGIIVQIASHANVKIVNGIIQQNLDPCFYYIITEFDTKTNLPSHANVSPDELKLKDQQKQVEEPQETPKKTYQKFNMNRFKKYKGGEQKQESLNLDESLFILR